MSQVSLIQFDGLKAKGINFSKVHLCRLERRGEFPRHVQLSAKRVAWVESEIDAWVNERIAARQVAA